MYTMRRLFSNAVSMKRLLIICIASALLLVVQIIVFQSDSTIFRDYKKWISNSYVNSQETSSKISSNNSSVAKIKPTTKLKESQKSIATVKTKISTIFHRRNELLTTKNYTKSNKSGNLKKDIQSTKQSRQANTDTTGIEEMTTGHYIDVTMSTQANTKQAEQWIHTKHYEYTINNTTLCTGSNESADISILVLVESAPGNFVKRHFWRQTWGSITNASGKEIRTAFVIARSGNNNTEQKIIGESNTYRDIIQIDFVDSYRNLTLKSILALRWVLYYCNTINWIFKTDDDVIVNYKNLVKSIQGYEFENKSLVYTGYMAGNLWPVRNNRSKWYISPEEYPYNYYPPYILGSGYILSIDAIITLYTAILITPLIPSEDAFLGFAANKTSIRPFHNKLCTPWALKKFDICTFRNMLYVHGETMKTRNLVWSGLHNDTLIKQSNCTLN